MMHTRMAVMSNCFTSMRVYKAVMMRVMCVYCLRNGCKFSRSHIVIEECKDHLTQKIWQAKCNCIFYSFYIEFVKHIVDYL